MSDFRRPMPGIRIHPRYAHGLATVWPGVPCDSIAGLFETGDSMRAIADEWFGVPLGNVLAAWRYSRLRRCRPHLQRVERWAAMAGERCWEAKPSE